MPEITVGRAADVLPAELRGLVDQLARAGELAALKVAAASAAPHEYSVSSEPSSLEAVMATGFADLPADTQAVAATNALSRLAAIDLHSGDAIDARARELLVPSAVRLPAAEQVSSRSASMLRALVPVERVELSIHGVTCLDGTDGVLGSEAGDDEIFLGGSTVDAVGTTAAVAPFLVGEHFDGGDAVDYVPPRLLAAFDASVGDEFPKRYFATVVLSEADNGGMSELLAEIVNWIKGKVSDAIATVAGGIIGSAFGGVGAAIGAAIGAVLDELAGVFKDIWEDDMFAPYTIHATLDAPDTRFPDGGTQGPVGSLTFNGHGGSYEVRYSWGLAVSQVDLPEPGVIYAVNEGGGLLWYRHEGSDDGVDRWAPASAGQVGDGWLGFKHVIAGPDGVVYAVQPETIDGQTGQRSGGKLLWYRNEGRDDGTGQWAIGSGSVVADGWHRFTHVVSGGGGVLYGVEVDGDLVWHRHDGHADGSARWAEGSGTRVGQGWAEFQRVLSGRDGVIYAIQPRRVDGRTGQRLGGHLLWYRHDGHEDGTSRWAAGSGNTVGNGWDGFLRVFVAPDGVIYAVEQRSADPRTGRQSGGRLLWYRHDGRDDGTFRWAQRSGAAVGRGWQGFTHVFAG